MNTPEPKFIRIGDRLVEVQGFRLVSGKQVPVIKARAVEIPRADGGVDVVVKVPCLQISGNKE